MPNTFTAKRGSIHILPELEIFHFFAWIRKGVIQEWLVISSNLFVYAGEQKDMKNMAEKKTLTNKYLLEVNILCLVQAFHMAQPAQDAPILTAYIRVRQTKNPNIDIWVTFCHYQNLHFSSLKEFITVQSMLQLLKLRNLKHKLIIQFYEEELLGSCWRQHSGSMRKVKTSNCTCSCDCSFVMLLSPK